MRSAIKVPPQLFSETDLDYFMESIGLSEDDMIAVRSKLPQPFTLDIELEQCIWEHYQLQNVFDQFTQDIEGV